LTTGTKIPTKMNHKLRLKHSLLFPVFFIVIIWIVHIIQEITEIRLYQYGIYPLRLSGLKGIILSPLIHIDFSHLISNTIPLFVLSWGIFFFYRTLAYRIFFYSYLFSGIWIWFGARQAYHIGASGLVYAFAAFVFLSGILRKRSELMALAMVVVFLYGDLIWGIFPLVKDSNISYEAHFLGSLAGIILAIHYRHEGPQKKEPQWEEDNDDDDENDADKPATDLQTD
jgi:membrane associated rhomboid family serine protease